jgi:predicted transcriptional regulator
MSGSPSSYRDRIYIVKDVILKLVEYSELNQTALVSFCGLNLKNTRLHPTGVFGKSRLAAGLGG